jgi:hypothetical protein
VRIASLRGFLFSLMAFILLSSLVAFARRIATQISSAYGTQGGQSSWLLSGPTTTTTNGVQVTTEIVCPNAGLASPVCTGSYLFLYQIPSGPNNLVLTFSGLSGFAFDSSTPTFGVLLCDPSATNNMLCTQNLSAADVDNLTIGFDAWTGDLIVTIPALPPSADTLTFFIIESSPGEQVVPRLAPSLDVGGLS